MVEVKNMHFATSIAVLFAVKESKGHKTLQDTYQDIGSISSFEDMLELLRVSYEKGENKRVNSEEFLMILSEEGIGFLKITSLFNLVIEGLLYDGMDEQERAEAKKLMEAKIAQNQI